MRLRLRRCACVSVTLASKQPIDFSDIDTEVNWTLRNRLRDDARRYAMSQDRAVTLALMFEKSIGCCDARVTETQPQTRGLKKLTGQLFLTSCRKALRRS